MSLLYAKEYASDLAQALVVAHLIDDDAFGDVYRVWSVIVDEGRPQAYPDPDRQAIREAAGCASMTLIVLAAAVAVAFTLWRGAGYCVPSGDRRGLVWRAHDKGS